ncbi:hypothetical protein N9L68_04920 [bacterium]|nr:hypothetical protein [bacterium]
MVFAVPTVSRQEKELSEQCAALISTKLLHLAEQRGFKWDSKALPSYTAIMTRVQEQVSNPAFKQIETSKKKQSSAVAETVAPKVIQMDADGRPLTLRDAMVTKQQVAVDTTPWSTWA